LTVSTTVTAARLAPKITAAAAAPASTPVISPRRDRGRDATGWSDRVRGNAGRDDRAGGDPGRDEPARRLTAGITVVAPASSVG